MWSNPVGPEGPVVGPEGPVVGPEGPVFFRCAFFNCSARCLRPLATVWSNPGGPEGPFVGPEGPFVLRCPEKSHTRVRGGNPSAVQLF